MVRSLRIDLIKQTGCGPEVDQIQFDKKSSILRLKIPGLEIFFLRNILSFQSDLAAVFKIERVQSRK